MSEQGWKQQKITPEMINALKKGSPQAQEISTAQVFQNTYLGNYVSLYQKSDISTRKMETYN